MFECAAQQDPQMSQSAKPEYDACTYGGVSIGLYATIPSLWYP